MGNGDILMGVPCDGLESRPGGVAILLDMLHANETGISSGRLGLWLVCALHLLPLLTTLLKNGSEVLTKGAVDPVKATFTNTEIENGTISMARAIVESFTGSCT